MLANSSGASEDLVGIAPLAWVVFVGERWVEAARIVIDAGFLPGKGGDLGDLGDCTAGEVPFRSCCGSRSRVEALILIDTVGFGSSVGFCNAAS